MTLNDIKARCFIDDEGHWIWKGAKSEDRYPRIWAPDYSKEGAPMRSQPGRRAVWHVKTKKAIPEGWRVFGTCTHIGCLSPVHMDCGPTAEWGKQVTKTGVWKGQIKRILASRATGRKRSNASPELISEVLGTETPGTILSAEKKVSQQVISKIRNGKLICFEPVGGIFSGLLAANENSKRRA